MNQFIEVGKYWLRGLRKGEGGGPRSKGFTGAGTTSSLSLRKWSKGKGGKVLALFSQSSAQML
jgi:hypothetical protein